MEGSKSKQLWSWEQAAVADTKLLNWVILYYIILIIVLCYLALKKSPVQKTFEAMLATHFTVPELCLHAVGPNTRIIISTFSFFVVVSCWVLPIGSVKPELQGYLPKEVFCRPCTGNHHPKYQCVSPASLMGTVFFYN